MEEHSPQKALPAQPPAGRAGLSWSDSLLPPKVLPASLPSTTDPSTPSSGQEDPRSRLGTAKEKEPPALLPSRANKAEVGADQQSMLYLLGGLAFALRSFNNLNQILEFTAFVASQLTGADGGALVLFNPNGTIQLDQLHCFDLERREQIRAEMEQIAQALSAQEPLLKLEGSLAVKIPALEHLLDERLRQILGPDGRLFGTPLLIRNSVQGRLYVFSRQPNYHWTEPRQQLLRLVADQAGVAIENERLRTALRRRMALEKEMEIGSYIQTQLLPRQYPQVRGIRLAARCRVASKVGGDYYDFIKIPRGPASAEPASNRAEPPEPSADSRLAIVIGDVMGKGVPAGLLMSMTRAMVRAEALNGHSPARVLQHLNRAMYSDLKNSSRFISLFYSEYDPCSRRLCFGNAAHNPPLWWQARTREIQPLDTEGALIGLEEHSQYSESCVQLQPGDVVVYYTDGYIEVANTRGERLETAGLMDAIQRAASCYESPEEILESLFAQMDAFRGRQGVHFVVPEPAVELELLFREEISLRPMPVDDTTLVVLKVLPEPEAA